MEEFLLSAVKLEVYLPAEPVKLAANEISMLRKARRRRVACQGEPIHAFLVVSIPKDQKYNGRSLREFAYFYSNLQVSLQILQTTQQADGKDTIRPVQCTSLLRSGTVSGATIVEAGRGGEWCEVGTAEESQLLASGEVVYRVEAAMAVDRDIVGRPVVLRIQIAPSTFPVDESASPMPSVFEDTDQAQSISQTMQALYMRASGSKGTRPSYFMDVKLSVIDPLHVETSISTVGDKALISLVLRNERTDGNQIQVESVLASEGTLGRMAWEGGSAGGLPQQFPLTLNVGEDVSLIGSMQLDALAHSRQPPRLLLWWGGQGISGAQGSQSILKMVDLQDQMVAAGNPERDQVRIHLTASGPAILGKPFTLSMSVTNLGSGSRYLSVIFPDEERQRKSLEQIRGKKASLTDGGGHGGFSSDYWALLPLIGAADFGLVEPGKTSSRPFGVLPRVEGFAKLEGLTVVDRLTNELWVPRSDWACLVEQPGAGGTSSVSETAQQTPFSQSRSPSRSPQASPAGTVWPTPNVLARIESMGQSAFIDALSPY